MTAKLALRKQVRGGGIRIQGQLDSTHGKQWADVRSGN